MKPEALAMRSTDRWGMPVTVMPNFEAFLAMKSVESGILTIDGFDHPIDIHARIVPGRPVMFSYHGAFVRKPETMLPYFTGLEIARGLDVSFIAFSDPTLYANKKLGLSWFAGSETLLLQSIMPSIIAKMVALCDASRLIFFGVSGGGFASLLYSAKTDGALCIAVNPQTDVLRYNPQFVADYGKAAFGFEDTAQSRAGLPTKIKTEVIPLWGVEASANLIYLQNNSDWHVTSHLNPFMRAVGAGRQFPSGAVANEMVAGRAWLALQDYGNGHVAPDWNYLRRLLATAVDHAANWPAWIKSGDLEPILRRP